LLNLLLSRQKPPRQNAAPDFGEKSSFRGGGRRNKFMA
jgi:hypothetical protein